MERLLVYGFGVGKSTVYSIVHKVCKAIYEDLLNVYVKFPTGDELKNVVRGYEESCGFPNCGGAIDGTHIPTKVSLFIRKFSIHWSSSNVSRTIWSNQSVERSFFHVLFS
jgi:hypothetical protein